MKIYPKIGVDTIRFGMSQKQIQAELGAPIGKETTAEEDIWEYANGVELAFEDDRLSSITLSDEQQLLNTKPIVGISEQVLQEQFPAFSLDEDYGSDGKSYYDEGLEIMAWVFDGKVFNVVVFPTYEQDE